MNLSGIAWAVRGTLVEHMRPNAVESFRLEPTNRLGPA
ncbi:MAG: hypothetical protein QOE16_1656 [Microbacteriaceae bacterium]|jgi:hypothetical protein|nr:hypothetical protein [Microbacteriaceae bacterium]